MAAIAAITFAVNLQNCTPSFSVFLVCRLAKYVEAYWHQVGDEAKQGLCLLFLLGFVGFAYFLRDLLLFFLEDL